MSMSDPIADMLTRIRNASRADRQEVSMNSSTIKKEIAEILKSEGYIIDYQVDTEQTFPELKIKLKYFQGEPVIEAIDRISKPGRRVYRGLKDLPSVSGGLGIAILSTSKGVMTAKAAKAKGVGGEVICTVM